jgi:chorismate mutase
VPVLIKNPVNPDIKLWIGAIERLRRSGIENIGIIHRGFSSYGNTEFRNVPMWQIPIEMKRLFPEIPLICDPSHICGKRDTILSVSQKSIDLDYDGLIIESHYDPDSAMTDKEQQLNTDQLDKLLKTLVWKSSSTNTKEYLNKLDNLREQINHLDEELLTLISNRMKVAKEIGEIKKDNKITVLQSNRYNEIIERAINKGEKVGLSKDFIKLYLEAIHIESIRIQNLIQVNQ